MTVYRKETLLQHHAFSQLHLIHAALVDAFEYHGINHRMPVNRLLFVCADDGKAQSVIRDCSTGNLLPMKAGYLYFIPCNHSVDLNIAEDLHFLSLQFNLDLFYGFDVMEACSRCEMIDVPALVAELQALLERETELRTLYRINEIIFHQCVQWCPEEQPDIQARLLKSHKYEKVLALVQQSGNAAVTVAMLADINGQRKDVFSRNFTSDMGITPKEFISAALTRKAAAMLLVPGTSVTQVARTLNFSSEYYFSHFFKQHIGMAPKIFQQHSGAR